MICTCPATADSSVTTVKLLAAPSNLQEGAAFFRYMGDKEGKSVKKLWITFLLLRLMILPALAEEIHLPDADMRIIDRVDKPAFTAIIAQDAAGTPYLYVCEQDGHVIRRTNPLPEDAWLDGPHAGEDEIDLRGSGWSLTYNQQPDGNFLLASVVWMARTDTLSAEAAPGRRIPSSAACGARGESRSCGAGTGSPGTSVSPTANGTCPACRITARIPGTSTPGAACMRTARDGSSWGTPPSP